MLQKVLLDIDLEKPLSSYGDGHMIVYDITKQHYYVTTVDSFLASQNKKIIDLEEKYKNLTKGVSEFLEKTKNQYDNFIKSTNEEYNKFLETENKEKQDFLHNQQEFNKKVLAMVKSVVLEEDK